MSGNNNPVYLNQRPGYQQPVLDIKSGGQEGKRPEGQTPMRQTAGRTQTYVQQLPQQQPGRGPYQSPTQTPRPMPPPQGQPDPRALIYHQYTAQLPQPLIAIIPQGQPSTGRGMQGRGIAPLPGATVQIGRGHGQQAGADTVRPGMGHLTEALSTAPVSSLSSTTSTTSSNSLSSGILSPTFSFQPFPLTRSNSDSERREHRIKSQFDPPSSFTTESSIGLGRGHNQPSGRPTISLNSGHTAEKSPLPPLSPTMPPLSPLITHSTLSSIMNRRSGSTSTTTSSSLQRRSISPPPRSPMTLASVSTPVRTGRNSIAMDDSFLLTASSTSSFSSTLPSLNRPVSDINITSRTVTPLPPLSRPSSPPTSTTGATTSLGGGHDQPAGPPTSRIGRGHSLISTSFEDL